MMPLRDKNRGFCFLKEKSSNYELVEIYYSETLRLGDAPSQPPVRKTPGPSEEEGGGWTGP